MRFLFVLEGKIQGQKPDFKTGLKCVFVGNKTRIIYTLKITQKLHNEDQLDDRNLYFMKNDTL